MNERLRENLRRYVDPLEPYAVKTLREIGFFDYWSSRRETNPMSRILEAIERSPEYIIVVGYSATPGLILERLRGLPRKDVVENFWGLLEEEIRRDIDLERGRIGQRALDYFTELERKAAMLRILVPAVAEDDRISGRVLVRMSSVLRERVSRDQEIAPSQREYVLRDALYNLYNLAAIAAVDLELGRIEP